MKSKIEELEETVSDLRKTISSLEERIVKEESDKLVRLPASFVIEYLKRFCFIVWWPHFLVASQLGSN